MRNKTLNSLLRSIVWFFTTDIVVIINYFLKRDNLKLVLYIDLFGVKYFFGENAMLNLPVDKTGTISVAGFDKFNNPVTLPNSPTWALTDTTLAVLSPAANGLSVGISSPSGKIGSDTVTISVIDANGNTVSTTISVNTEAGALATLVATATVN